MGNSCDLRSDSKGDEEAEVGDDVVSETLEELKLKRVEPSPFSRLSSQPAYCQPVLGIPVPDIVSKTCKRETRATYLEHEQV